MCVDVRVTVDAVCAFGFDTVDTRAAGREPTAARAGGMLIAR
jgi:hypothetical protein